MECRWQTLSESWAIAMTVGSLINRSYPEPAVPFHDSKSNPAKAYEDLAWVVPPYIAHILIDQMAGVSLCWGIANNLYLTVRGGRSFGKHLFSALQLGSCPTTVLRHLTVKCAHHQALPFVKRKWPETPAWATGHLSLHALAHIHLV